LLLDVYERWKFFGIFYGKVGVDDGEVDDDEERSHLYGGGFKSFGGQLPYLRPVTIMGLLLGESVFFPLQAVKKRTAHLDISTRWASVFLRCTAEGHARTAVALLERAQ